MNKQKAINFGPTNIGPDTIDPNWWYMWVDALQDIDPAWCVGHSDSKPLCDLLRNQQAELSMKVRGYLADLFEQVELRRKRGRPKTPAYAISEADQLWWFAYGE